MFTNLAIEQGHHLVSVCFPIEEKQLLGCCGSCVHGQHQGGWEWKSWLLGKSSRMRVYNVDPPSYKLVYNPI